MINNYFNHSYHALLWCEDNIKIYNHGSTCGIISAAPRLHTALSAAPRLHTALSAAPRLNTALNIKFF